MEKPAQSSNMLYFLGDSHLRAVTIAINAGLFGGIRCQVEYVGGATAVGLRHPTAKTQALVKYRECLLPFRPDVIPVFQLGEVDCGFVIWLRAQRYGESIDQQFEASIHAYRGFLKEVKNAGYSPLVTSATLPTIRDGDLDGEVSLLRHEVRATYRERTELTLRYNDRLKTICSEEKLGYIDFDIDLIDPETKLLREWFRHPDPKDHHLHPERAGELWVRRVLTKLDERDQMALHTNHLSVLSLRGSVSKP